MFPHGTEEGLQISDSMTGADASGCPPTERRIRLQRISQKLIKLDREESTESIDHKRLELKHLWNTALLIHTLPCEVLTRILANLQADPLFSRLEPSVHPTTTGGRHGARPVTDWHGLMLVCSYWRNLLVSNPAFWRVVDTKRHVEWVKLCLDRSAAASLDVHVGGLDRFPLNILYPHAHRFQKLLFAGLPESQMREVLPPLFGGGMPLLEHFDIYTGLIEQRPSVDLDLYLTSHYFPRLHTLVLGWVISPGDQALYAQLRTLSLSHCFQNISFRLDSFIDALAGCTQLEELTLNYTLDTLTGDPEWKPRGPITPRQPIPLPSLRRFWLDAREIDLVSYFLAHFNIPASAKFFVASELRLNGGAESPNNEKTISTLLPPNRSQALPILSMATEIVTTFLGEQWSIHAEIPCGAVDARGRQEFPDAIFRLLLESGRSWDQWMAQSLSDLTQCFGRSPLTRLQLHAEDYGSTTVAVWEGVFRTFSLLKKLVICTGPRAELSKVFRGLHAASNVDAPVARSKLKWVSVEGLGTMATYEAMRECFQHRADRGACLEVLDLSMHNDKDLTSGERSGCVEKLRKVVEHVRVEDY